MEQILGTVIGYDTIVLSVLIAGIAVVLLLLLILNFSNPESVILSEYGRSDEFEGTLRRVLGSRVIATGSATGSQRPMEPTEGGDTEALETEILEKDQKIAELQKQITAGVGGGVAIADASGEDSDNLKERIRDLEGRLEEYEIIEDDIADLSKYKTKNAELAAELERLKGITASEPSATSPSETSSELDSGDPAPEAETETTDIEEPDGEDLVAEFEKIVNQEEGNTEVEPGLEAVEDNTDPSLASSIVADEAESPDEVDEYGNVMMAKLSEMNAEPDSKEEAEVLINDLKILKKGSSQNKTEDEDSGDS